VVMARRPNFGFRHVFRYAPREVGHAVCVD